MRQAALLLAAALLPGCINLGETTVAYDPETGEATLHRSMLAGPVDTGLKVSRPDGTKVEFWWRSDVDLSAAESVALARENNLRAALEKIPAGTALAGLATP